MKPLNLFFTHYGLIKVKKALIIRFSSFGDIAQALTASIALKKIYKHENIQVDWVTRADFKDFIEEFESVNTVWALSKKSGLRGLLQLALLLRRENYDLVYDAHNNIRSFVLKIFLLRFKTQFITRSKNRIKRFLLFYLRINTFKMPFLGAQSFIDSLNPDLEASHLIAKKIKFEPLPVAIENKILNKNFIVLAPFAAWDLKRWPDAYWIELIIWIQKQYPDLLIFILGGPKDELVGLNNSLIKQESIINLSGQLSWTQTSHLIERAQISIGNDTGALHVADLLGKLCIALIGPTAFGYPSRPLSHTLEVELYCKPCTKDGSTSCTNKVLKKCLFDITPDRVKNKLSQVLQP